jgi:hypothetical protein
MDERILFDRFHQALDVEPRAGAYDRLRIALAKKPVNPQRPAVFSMSWPKMGLRLAAVMTVVVLAIAAAAAFLAAHRVADNVGPADSGHAITAYKLAVSNANTKVQTLGASWSCNGGSQLAACEADASRMLPVANQFVDDLNRVRVPARFAIAHAQLRVHVAAQDLRTEALLAASQAHDAAAVDRELAAIQGETGWAWVQAMVSSIVSSRQGTAATYVESVRGEKATLESCSACQDLAGQNQYSCTGSQASTCQDLVTNIALEVKSFQDAVVRLTAPSSLTPKDNRLQRDLAQADTALIAMADALTAGDQAGFTAGRTSLQQAIPAISRDAADLLNS